MIKNIALASTIVLMTSMAMAMQEKDLEDSSPGLPKKTTTNVELADFSQLSLAGMSERILLLYDRCKEYITPLYGESLIKEFSTVSASYRDIEEFWLVNPRMQQKRFELKVNCHPYVKELFYISEYLKIVRSELIHRHLRGEASFTPNKTLKLKALDDGSLRHVLDPESLVVFPQMHELELPIKELETNYLAFMQFSFDLYTSTYYIFLQVAALRGGDFFSGYKETRSRKSKGRVISERHKNQLVEDLDFLLAETTSLDAENKKKLHSLYGSPEYLEDSSASVYRMGSLATPKVKFDEKIKSFRDKSLSFATYHALYTDENLPKETIIEVSEYYLKYRKLRKALSEYVIKEHRKINGYIKGKPVVVQKEFKLPDYFVTPSNQGGNEPTLEERSVEDLMREFEALDKKNKKKKPKKSKGSKNVSSRTRTEKATSKSPPKKEEREIVEPAASEKESKPSSSNSATGKKKKKNKGKKKKSGNTLMEKIDQTVNTGSPKKEASAKTVSGEGLEESPKLTKNQRRKAGGLMAKMAKVKDVAKAATSALQETAKRVAPSVLPPAVNDLFARFQSQGPNFHLIQAAEITKRITRNSDKLHILAGQASASSSRLIKSYTVKEILDLNREEAGNESPGDSNDPEIVGLDLSEDIGQLNRFHDKALKASKLIQVEGAKLLKSLRYLSRYGRDTQNDTLLDNVRVMSLRYQNDAHNISHYLHQSWLLLLSKDKTNDIRKEIVKARDLRLPAASDLPQEKGEKESKGGDC